MTDKPNILQRLIAVMGEVGYVQKDQKKIDGKYTAVRYDSIVEKLHDSFVKNGVVAISETLPDFKVNEFLKDGKQWTRLDALIKTTFYNADDPKDFVVATAPGMGLDNGDKGPGKAHTYGVKSNLLKSLMIVTGDDEEERAPGSDDVNGSGDEQTTTDSSGSMLDDEAAALLRQIATAADTATLKAILTSGMAAAKEAGDTKRHAEFKEAAVKRAEALINPVAKPAVTEEVKPDTKKASATIIKIVKKALASKKASDADALVAIAEADKGEFDSLDALDAPAAQWVMNVYVKTLEPAHA